MLSTARFRLLNLNQNRKILNYCAFHISSSLEKKKTAPIQKLIDDIGNPDSKQGWDNLVKHVQDRNKKKQQKREYVKRKAQIKEEATRKQKENMVRFEELSDQKGEDFWFQDIEVKQRVIPKSNVETVTTQEDLIEKEMKECLASDPKTPLEIGKLKERIEEDGSGREVSKLMSAMIDSVDHGAQDVELNFQKLIKAFNSNENKNLHNTRTRSRSLDNNFNSSKSWKRRVPIKTFFDKPTSLFEIVSTGVDPDCVGSSIFFESKWNEELQSLLPEVNPQNAFEVKMLDIDREWRFPIDNEQDMGVEEDTGFDEHVFLDHLLEEFPENGPVYKFMELVVTGLQQNPHLSVEDKTNYILWFKEYFDKFSEEDLKVANLEF